ncbi:hypothetical protein HZU77_015705 [Neisseriaceae bacterium TC5R-5]|nr:hypothetical protein [Neisseriaceae bacterium TC5R-5]
MIKQLRIRLGVVLVALLCTVDAWASLGRLNVRSHLGELLQADIELTGVRAEEFDSARVGLAGADTFQELNVDYAPTLSALRFSLTPGPNGVIVRVSSVNPINDPYLRFVVEAKTASGRSVRNYTVLLDPADYTAQTTAVNIVQDQPNYANSDQASRYRNNPAPAEPTGPQTLAAAPGLTLHSLALQARPKGASLKQTMAALVQANPQAFIDGDSARLREDAILNVPSAQKIRSLTAVQVARILGAAPPPNHATNPGRAKSAPAPAVVAKPGKDVLKLLPAEATATPTNSQLGELEQQISQREQDLKKAESRITALEEQLKALQSGHAITPIASAPHAAVAASAPAGAHIAPQPHATASHPVVKKAGHKPVMPPPAPAPSFWDSILTYLPWVGGGIAALGLLGGVIVLVLRRRKAPAELLPLSSNMSAVAGASSQSATALPGAGNSFMSNFTQSNGAIDTVEVDPIAEAEVYIAYGRDLQAEEILKDALSKNPARHEVRLKLMEIYVSRSDNINFEMLARELHSALDGRGPVWAQAAEMGRTLDPGNPLYQIAEKEVAELESVPNIAPVVEAGIDLDQELFGETVLAEPTAPEAAAPADAIDDNSMAVADPLASLFESADTSEALKPADAAPLDFNLDSPFSTESMMMEEAQPENVPEAPIAETNLLDFDFKLDSPEVSSSIETSEAAAMASLESLYAGEELNNLVPATVTAADLMPPEEESVEDDSLSTKLDLAKVYLDMGDKEGAREVLQDLIGEAKDPLKTEAQALLSSLDG